MHQPDRTKIDIALTVLGEFTDWWLFVAYLILRISDPSSILAGGL